MNSENMGKFFLIPRLLIGGHLCLYSIIFSETVSGGGPAFQIGAHTEGLLGFQK